jgi:hypothetical protein
VVCDALPAHARQLVGHDGVIMLQFLVDASDAGSLKTSMNGDSFTCYHGAGQILPQLDDFSHVLHR